MAFRCLLLSFVLHLLTVEHKHSATVAMPRFAQHRFVQHSSVVVDTDFFVLLKSAGKRFDSLPALTDCVGNQAIGIRSTTVDHRVTAIRRKLDEDSFAVVGTQMCFP